MKVIQILPELNSGGVERGTLEVAKYLVDHGHQSIVISNGGRLVDQLTAEGSRHIQLPVHKKRITSLRYVRPLRQVLAEEKPDILHLRSRLPAWLAYLAWRKMDPATRPKLVTTVHGFYSVNPYSAIMTKGQRVIAVSASVKDYILNNYPKTDPNLIKIIHRGVDPAEFHPHYTPPTAWLEQWFQDFPETRDKLLITLPGRITRIKGHNDFIQLINQARKQSDLPIHGLIAGGTDPRKAAYHQELKTEINQLGLQDHITFTGHRSDLREILAISHIACSLTTKPESFGRTALEALALGTPLLGYEHGGVGEILDALLPSGRIQLGDSQTLLNKLLTWLPAPPQPATTQPFTLDAMLDQTLQTYLNLQQAP